MTPVEIDLNPKGELGMLSGRGLKNQLVHLIFAALNMKWFANNRPAFIIGCASLLFFVVVLAIVINSSRSADGKAVVPRISREMSVLPERSIKHPNDYIGRKVEIDSSVPTGRVSAKTISSNSPLDPYRNFGKRVGEFVALDEDGKITSLAAKIANLTAEESRLAQGAFDVHALKMRSLIQSRIVQDPDLQNSNKDVFVYKIPSFSESAIDELNVLLGDLDASIGREKRSSLMDGYLASAKFFGYGTRDTIIEFSKGPPISELASNAFDIDDGNWMVKVVGKDPKSGVVIGTWKGTLNVFEKSMPGVFELK